MSITTGARRYWRGGYLVEERPLVGKYGQIHGAQQQFRPATCLEVGCSWLEFGQIGSDAGAPFQHPQGVECGDFRGCLPCTSPNRKNLCGKCEPCKSGTANCPCLNQKRRHRVLIVREPRLNLATTSGVRLLGSPEWIDTLREGQFKADHIRERGI